MPLKKSKSKEAVSYNIETMMKKEHMPHEQAVAVAMNMAGKKKKK